MRRLASRVAFAAGLAALLLGGIEAACRLGERLAYGARWTQGGPEGLYQAGPDGNPRLVPGARLRGWLYDVQVNSQGFRGKEIAQPKPAGRHRVWCLGGSTTFDIYARDDAAAWPARLGSRLDDSGRDTDVVNAGVPGMVLSSSTVDLLARDEALRPDIVVVHHGPNDLRLESRVGLAETPAPEVHVALVRVLARILPPAPPLPEWRERRLHEGGIPAIRARLVALIDAAESRGMAVVLATLAHRAADDAEGEQALRAVAEGVRLYRMPPEAVIAMFGQYNAMVRGLAVERGLPLADVRASVPTEGDYWGDSTHFTAPGAEIAATTVADTIIAAGLLDRPSR